MRAIILSAGYGTRLWPLTEDRTKPAIPILGKPLVGYVAEYLASFGVNEILVNLHHKPESVKQALGDGKQFRVKLRYIDEPEILGTSGALDNAREFFQEDTFVVINGKIITDIDLNAAIDQHRESSAIATLVLVPNTRRERFSMVQTKDGFVEKFGGMPEPLASDPAPLMFTGIHIMQPNIFEYIPRGIFSDSVIDVYPKVMAAGERIAAHVAAGKWRELSTLQRYLDINLEMMQETGVSVSFGKNCLVAEGARVEKSILWDNVRVDADAVVDQSVLADDVYIKSGEVIERSVVVRERLIAGRTAPPKALNGRIQGENFVVSLDE